MNLILQCLMDCMKNCNENSKFNIDICRATCGFHVNLFKTVKMSDFQRYGKSQLKDLSLLKLL